MYGLERDIARDVRDVGRSSADPQRWPTNMASPCDVDNRA